MSGYLLEMKGIVKQFDGVYALNGIDIKIKPGECIGLCGENGAGYLGPLKKSFEK